MERGSANGVIRQAGMLQERAKFGALISAQTCTNTYYFLNEANYIGRLAGRGIVIIDECDTLESILIRGYRS